MLGRIWSQYLRPLLRRPPRFQVAALCYRHAGTAPEILMITSLHTRRWILPKGWPKPGLDAGGVALEEAWEEAGVRSRGGAAEKIGSYSYDKRLRGGIPVSTDVDVFAIEVETLDDTYPEHARRERRWMSAEAAAEAVDEPGLSEILRRFPRRRVHRAG